MVEEIWSQAGWVAMWRLTSALNQTFSLLPHVGMQMKYGCARVLKLKKLTKQNGDDI